MVEKLKKIEDKVKDILERYPATKDDDIILFAEYCKLYFPQICNIPFYQALYITGLPSYESVSRARRKLQEKYPELRGTKYHKRQETQCDYIEYALEDKAFNGCKQFMFKMS